MNPIEVFMGEFARLLTDPLDGFLLNAKFLILDRDPRLSAAFRDILEAAGATPLFAPALSKLQRDR